ncbi:MAG: CBS domain-containing protein [Candidatus Sericytochromatia bacterium]|nr:CBS domain-containing protein [Candidatus Sericytochromatia bacterium]
MSAHQGGRGRQQAGGEHRPKTTRHVAGVPIMGKHRAPRFTKVAEVMTPHVVAVTGVTFLPEAARIMKEEDVGALPVVKEDGTLIGIVTDRDITVRAVAAGLDPREIRVGEIATMEDLVTLSPATTLAEAEACMAEHQVRRLPVVESGERVVGMLALADLASLASGKDLKAVVEDISRAGGEHTQVAENLPKHG